MFRKIFFFVSFLSLITLPSFPGNFFDDLSKALDTNDNNSGHRPSRGQEAFSCPSCGRNFTTSLNSCPKVCSNCKAGNGPGVSYCRNCGASLETNFYMVCPYCKYQFPVSNVDSDNNSQYCERCGKYYPAGKRHCPYCRERGDRYDDRDRDRDGEWDDRDNDRDHYRDHERNRDYRNHDRDRDRDWNDDRDNRKHDRDNYQDTRSGRRGGAVEIESFTMPTNDKFPKRYNISSQTSDQNFSKVVIYARLHGRPPLFNSIRYCCNGKWVDTKTAATLNDGRNEYGVSIPRGSSELIISFKGGQGTEIRVTLE